MVSVATAGIERPTARPDEPRTHRVHVSRAATRDLASAVADDRDHLRSLIAQLPLFAGLDNGILHRVAESAELRRVGQGEFVVRAGERARHFFGVVFGQVQLLLGDPVCEPSVLALIGPGNTFGEAAMWLGVEAPLSARAAQDSLIIAFPRETSEPLIARYPQLSVRFLSCISQGLHNLVANIGSHKQKSGEQRVASYLLGLPNLDGDLQRPRIRLPASKGTIASLVSIQPETLSRILRRFQQNGWIEMRGRELTIAQVPALKALAEAPVPPRH